MSKRDDFSRSLFESSKRELAAARISKVDSDTQAHLRHALMMGFSYLEFQIFEICRHLETADQLSVSERGVLLQREVRLRNGEFIVAPATKYWTLEDRLRVVQHRFAKTPLGKELWWPKLAVSANLRNDIAHPKEPVELTVENVETALLSVLGCTDHFFNLVYGKGVPYASHGLTPKT